MEGVKENLMIGKAVSVGSGLPAAFRSRGNRPTQHQFCRSVVGSYAALALKQHKKEEPCLALRQDDFLSRYHGL